MLGGGTLVHIKVNQCGAGGMETNGAWLLAGQEALLKLVKWH
jgi:hypothetical protein